jgi:Domain of unknown function (DUF3883)
MRHFLQYWKTYNPAKELDTPLDFAASAQFKRVEPGDTLWIVALKQHKLTLLGRLIVGKVVSRREAIKELGDRVYDAPLVALAETGTEQDIIEADIQPLAPLLRFNSPRDRLSLPDSGRTDGKQLQRLRELTLEASAVLQSVLDSGGAKARKPYPRRVLFARVGWMTYYAGPQSGDEKPIGGGENNKKNIGHEVFNFTDFGGRLYGYVSPTNGRITLERIDPAAGDLDRLEDVLVVFVAQQKIVGWYRAATVHRAVVDFPPTMTTEIRKRLKHAETKNFKHQNYRFEVLIDKAVLLPKHERTHEIPGNVKGGFGQSNVCYPYQNSGKRKSASWMDEVVSYVLNYDKENLLKNPNADNESDEAATISQEQAAGFQSNIAIRRAIENFAMDEAKSVLIAKGYKNLKNTANFRPYDYICEREGKNFFVEVKGTQTTGKTLILTRGEVEHIGSHADQCILVLVRSVSVSGKKTIRVSGGTAEVKESWSLCSEDLRPIQYKWTVS